MPEAAFLCVFAAFSLKETHTGSFFSSLQPQLCLSICVCWKHRCLLIHTTKSSDSVISSTQGNKRYGRSSHRRFFCELFSKGMVQCARGVSFLSSEPVGKHFPEPKTQSLKRKQPFCLTKLEYLQSQTCQNTTLGHFSIFYGSKFHQVFVFSGRIMVLAVSCREVLWQYCFSW